MTGVQTCALPICYVPVARSRYDTVTRFEIGDGKTLDVITQTLRGKSLVGIATAPLLTEKTAPDKDGNYFLEDVLKAREMSAVEVRRPSATEREFLRNKGILSFHPTYYVERRV